MKHCQNILQKAISINYTENDIYSIVVKIMKEFEGTIFIRTKIYNI